MLLVYWFYTQNSTGKSLISLKKLAGKLNFKGRKTEYCWIPQIISMSFIEFSTDKEGVRFEPATAETDTELEASA